MSTQKNKKLKTGTKKKKKKSNILDEAHMQVQMGIFVIYPSNFLHLIFSSFLGENFLVDPGRKHPDLTILFPSPPPNQTPSKKFYSFSLSLNFFFILPKIHSTKNTNVRATTWWQQIKEQSKTTKFFWLRDDDKNLQDLNSILKKLYARSEFHPNGSKNLKTLLPNVLKL